MSRPYLPHRLIAPWACTAVKVDKYDLYEAAWHLIWYACSYYAIFHEAGIHQLLYVVCAIKIENKAR